jgi:hypothetical protein
VSTPLDHGSRLPSRSNIQGKNDGIPWWALERNAHVIFNAVWNAQTAHAYEQPECRTMSRHVAFFVTPCHDPSLLNASSLEGVTEMKNRLVIISSLVLASLLASSSALAQKPQPTLKGTGAISESDITFPYRFFETTNIWTFILLDTATGRAWQVNCSLDDAPAVRLVINGDSLLPAGAIPKNGRFTLQPTNNMYNYLLLDREDSRIWQLLWSLKAESRGIMRTIPLGK